MRQTRWPSQRSGQPGAERPNNQDKQAAAQTGVGQPAIACHQLDQPGLTEMDRDGHQHSGGQDIIATVGSVILDYRVGNETGADESAAQPDPPSSAAIWPGERARKTSTKSRGAITVELAGSVDLKYSQKGKDSQAMQGG